MKITRNLAELDVALSELGPCGFVPTMGALHPGHISLLTAAKAGGKPVAASIFVNPTQFGPNEDFNRYPRDEEGDLERLSEGGCDLVWLPDAATMYPAEGATTVSVAGPAARWEGAARPGHFAGVATVVAKLFGQVRPAAAYFGEKDWQQVQVITRMVADLHLPEERRAAPALYSALSGAARAIAAGESTAAVLAEGEAKLRGAGLRPDYFALVHAHSLEPLEVFDAPARLIAAARLGTIRLLDNVKVG